MAKTIEHPKTGLFPVIRVIGKTDIGLVRQGNEDHLHLDPKHNVFAVCDGMGGHQAGEVASMTASQTLEKVFADHFEGFHSDSRLSVGKALPQSADVLLKATRLANRAVYNGALQNDKLSGMGTTIVAVAFEGDLMSVAHVGDSRAYRIGERKLEPLTKDHSWLVEMQENNEISVEEANSFVSKNVITRALGVKETVEVDFRLVRVNKGDKFLLCSDGLCGFADDDEIFETVRPRLDDLNKLADSLVQMANDRGGADNVTVVLLEVEECKPSDLPEVPVFTLGEEDDPTLAAEDDWLKILNEKPEEPVADIPGDSGQSGPNKIILIAMFLLFILIAAAIIFMTRSPQ